MSKLPIIHVPRSDVTPEQAQDLRARAWRYVFDCYQAKQKGGVPSTAKNGKENKDVPVTPILPQQR